MEKAVLLLGSNLGDRQLVLEKARHLIENKLGQISRSSCIVESEAWGFESEYPFLNQALLIQTSLEPQSLLKDILEIEKELGRTRKTEQWESRIIDIDILFYGEMILEEKNLQIPHPYIAQRRFTLESLCQLMPDFIHPVYMKKLSELLCECEDQSKIRVIENSCLDEI